MSYDVMTACNDAPSIRISQRALPPPSAGLPVFWPRQPDHQSSFGTGQAFVRVHSHLGLNRVSMDTAAMYCCSVMCSYPSDIKQCMRTALTSNRNEPNDIRVSDLSLYMDSLHSYHNMRFRCLACCVLKCLIQVQYLQTLPYVLGHLTMSAQTYLETQNHLSVYFLMPFLPLCPACFTQSYVFDYAVCHERQVIRGVRLSLYDP